MISYVQGFLHGALVGTIVTVKFDLYSTLLLSCCIRLHTCSDCFVAGGH